MPNQDFLAGLTIFLLAIALLFGSLIFMKNSTIQECRSTGRYGDYPETRPSIGDEVFLGDGSLGTIISVYQGRGCMLCTVKISNSFLTVSVNDIRKKL